MNELDALLKRSFAEADVPADDGFSVKVAHAVSLRERAAQARTVLYSLGLAAGGAAVAYGVYSFASVYGPQIIASAGLELARAHGALASAPTAGAAAHGVIQSLGAGMTQVLLLTAAALTGGAVVYRSTQQN
jgi:hypothetical protein